MIPEIGWSGADRGQYWNTLLTNTLPNQYPYIKAVVIWEMPSNGLTVVDSTTLSSFKNGIGTNYYLSNTYSSLNVSPLNALNLTNPIQDSPLQSPIIRAAPSSSNNLSIIAAITVSITVAGVVLLALAKTQMKTKKVKNFLNWLHRFSSKMVLWSKLKIFDILISLGSSFRSALCQYNPIFPSHII